MTAQIISLRTRQPVALVRAWVPKINERVTVTLPGWEGEPPADWPGTVMAYCGDHARFFVELDDVRGRMFTAGLHEMRPEPKGAA